jgi:1-deoxy-D-xylulose-5-phosphate synthase
MYLDHIHTPSDLQHLSNAELIQLCAEIRQTIIQTVGQHGGHLASNLGTVEVTVALHKTFKIPDDALIFDVGHQAYAHKLLTGRKQQFCNSLRRFEGCCGFAASTESIYDTGSSGHAGTAISLASGLAAARRKNGHPGKVIALVGDGSLSNGISFEGLNAGGKNAENLIIVLNDNQMSISPNVGALARCLNRVISGDTYNRMKKAVRDFFRRWPSLKKSYLCLRRIQNALKYLLLPPGIFFQELGYRYLGPVDGHDLPALLKVFESIRELPGPIVLHLITEKGRGCEFASKNPSVYHGLSGFQPNTGVIPARNGDHFSAAFGRELQNLARQHSDIEAISAAMILGTGLGDFQKEFPERCHDVGIAEEHAVIFAAGLALGGKRPVCALYATFAQRALDCIYHDVVLPQLPVIFTLDRCGIVEDGPTHHGIYDLAFLRVLPHLLILAPRDESELVLMLRFAYQQTAPAVIRYPKGRGARDPRLPQAQTIACGKAEVLQDGSGPVIWALGPEVDTAFGVSDLHEQKTGQKCLIVNTRFMAPFDRQLAESLADRPMLTIEDHCHTGGLASALDEALAGIPHGIILHYGWPDQIIPHGEPELLRKKFRLTAEDIARDLLEKLHPVNS